jgi:DNA-binding MarR family transcriptional regulator
MPGVTQGREAEEARIILGLLESVERDSAQSQRRLASEFGIAVGLVNAYLKRCVNKGLVKVRQAPARRYAYYLTPQGFAEKSRLTVEYLSYSFSFFRRARADCVVVFETAKQRGWSRIALAGVSDLAEIAAICALESGVVIAAVVDAAATTRPRFVGLPVLASFDAATESFDGVIITDLKTAQETFDAAVAKFGAHRVAAPALLGVSVRANQQAAS